MLNFRSADALDGSIHSVKIGFTYRNDPLENQVISEFRWVRIKRKSGSILLDNQQEEAPNCTLLQFGASFFATSILGITFCLLALYYM